MSAKPKKKVRRRAKRLTPEQKKLIHSKPESNAGLGWSNGGVNPIAFEEGWQRRR